MAGNKSKQSGKSFEANVESVCKHLRASNIADIVKLPVQKIQNRYGKIIYTKKSTVDFLGYWRRNGTFICFDTKNRPTSVNSVTIGNDKQKHQIKYLYDAHLAGCDAFFLIRIRGDRLVKVRPDESWRDKQAIKIIFDKHIIFDWNNIYNFLEY